MLLLLDLVSFPWKSFVVVVAGAVVAAVVGVVATQRNFSELLLLT